MSQGPEEQYVRVILMALRNYSITHDQATWLQQFQWCDLKLEFSLESMRQMEDNALFLFPTHEEVWHHNK